MAVLVSDALVSPLIKKLGCDRLVPVYRLVLSVVLVAVRSAVLRIDVDREEAGQQGSDGTVIHPRDPVCHVHVIKAWGINV